MILETPEEIALWSAAYAAAIMASAGYPEKKADNAVVVFRERLPKEAELPELNTKTLPQ